MPLLEHLRLLAILVHCDNETRSAVAPTVSFLHEDRVRETMVRAPCEQPGLQREIGQQRRRLRRRLEWHQVRLAGARVADLIANDRCVV